MDIQVRNFLKILRTAFDDKKEISLIEPVDWELLSKLARRQNILPLFFEAANSIEDYMNASVYARDQLDTFAMVAEQIQRSSAFIAVYEKITDQGIYPIVMKGIVCRYLYGELGEHRPSGDEDLLIEIKDFYKVKTILEQEGYACEFTDVTEEQLKQIQEVTFYNMDQKLLLEVHTNVMGKANEERTRMSNIFQNAHERGRIMQIYGIDVKVMGATDALLLLILHTYKHFMGYGVGIRQIIDILLCYREYKHEISKEYFDKVLKICRAEHFWNDIRYIGNQYLGLCEEYGETLCCPEELLDDMMESGVFGSVEKTDRIAGGINILMSDHASDQSKLYRMFRAAFPSRRFLLAGYPYLEKKPWLLPKAWAMRLRKYIRYAGKDVWKISNEILQKSASRIELIKKYKM